MVPTTIIVTQEHIDSGIQCKSRKCPIALALIDRYNCRDVTVGYDDVIVGPLWLRGNHHLRLPPVAADFIRAFDSGEIVQPFAFVLDDGLPE